MLHTNAPIIKHKVGLLNLAEELGNVSKACRLMGVSRDTLLSLSVGRGTGRCRVAVSQGSAQAQRQKPD